MYGLGAQSFRAKLQRATAWSIKTAPPAYPTNRGATISLWPWASASSLTLPVSTTNLKAKVFK